VVIRGWLISEFSVFSVAYTKILLGFTHFFVEHRFFPGAPGFRMTILTSFQHSNLKMRNGPQARIWPEPTALLLHFEFALYKRYPDFIGVQNPFKARKRDSSASPQNDNFRSSTKHFEFAIRLWYA